MTSRAIVRRAFLTAAIVGSALLLINQGDALLEGRLSEALWWKVPLTYLVPYLVSTSGALAAGRLTTD